MAFLLDRSRRLFTRGSDLPALNERGTVTMRATDVRVERGGRAVLDRVSLAVHAGEVLALVGPNGAGKSTLLAALSGDQPVASGAVELDGHPLAHWSPGQMARRRAVLPQQHTVGFSFTARQVVRMGRSPWHRTSREADDDRRIDECLNMCDVRHLAGRPFSVLSGGERARVALARVLAQSTETVLLDEPTAALDLGHQEAVMRIVRDRAGEGAAVVVVLHDLGLAAAYADRICVLDGGRAVADGPPADVLTEELLSDVYGHPVEVFPHPRSGAMLVLPRRGDPAGTP
ncbi:heme ABC transporter ATP-binding protein [Rhodococcus spongiicola]|uniref:Heme ABC transporter ATP-binding protein n=1 Tax=Rhodococcus spongiicola TaxID=2487352 RepID=A0A438AYC0_9NOCA|nr:heme ABC transporter ATP-binding protein [Rhodococcus spongiicola]RVW03721.1 heme ABC transporter ATP-binding protein [Rhodococcus spongiicola]